MNKLGKLASGVLLGTSLFLGGVAGANINGYYNAENELENSVEESLLYGKVAESVIGEEISKKNLSSLSSKGFDLFNLGRKQFFENYLSWVKETKNVGVI